MKNITLIAGPNGSGKSTLASQIDLIGGYINIDMIEKEKFSHIADKSVRESSAMISAHRVISRHLKEESSFCLETVFAATDIPEFLRKAKARGYFIFTHYIATNNPKVNISRVAQRVLEGGHDVPVNKIVERYEKSLKILPKLMRFSDKFVLYDNSEDAIRAFAVKDNEQVRVIGAIPKWAEFIADYI
jgi:predicted ABC-type ATPase